MKKPIKTLCVIFIVLFCCSAFCGCVEPQINENDTKEVTTQQPQTQPSEETVIQPDLPEATFGGKTVTFLVTTETLWGYDQIDAEALNSDPVNDAIYNRNREIEDEYKIDIETVECVYTQVLTDVKKAHKANSFDYDVVIPRLNVAITLASEGILLSVDKLEYVDMNKPWWDQSIVEDLTIKDKLYFMAGDIHMYANDATWILLFNKDLASKLDIEDMYQLVRDGKWTLDKFNEIISKVSADMTGDGKITAEDRIGFVTMDLSVLAFIGSSGEQIFKKNSEGSYDFNIMSEKFVATYNKILTIMNENQSTLNVAHPQGWDLTAGGRMIGDAVQSLFSDNQCLFVGEVVDCISRYGDMEAPFGVLPFPKYDSTQTQYISTVVPDAMIVAVPTLIGQDAEKARELSIILEAMCAASYTTVKPAYYEVTLKRKKASDVESTEMLDIIFGKSPLGKRVYPIDALFGWGGVTDIIYGDVGSNTNKLSSRYGSLQKKVNSQMQSTLEKFANN